MDGRTLSDYNIAKESTLDLVRRVVIVWLCITRMPAIKSLNEHSHHMCLIPITGSLSSRYRTCPPCLRTQIVLDTHPISIAAGIGKAAAKTAPSARLRRGASFKLHITLIRPPADPTTNRRLKSLLSTTKKDGQPAPVNPANYLLRVDVPGAGGVGEKRDTAASFFTLTQALVFPAVAANGTASPHRPTKAKRKARLPPTNITSLPALGVTRLEWAPLAVSQYPAGSGLTYTRTLALTMRVGKAAPVGGGPLAFNITVAELLPAPLPDYTMQAVVPPVQVRNVCVGAGEDWGEVGRGMRCRYKAEIDQSHTQLQARTGGGRGQGDALMIERKRDRTWVAI